jgi:hypothetical protein
MGMLRIREHLGRSMGNTVHRYIGKNFHNQVLVVIKNHEMGKLSHTKNNSNTCNKVEHIQ